VLTKTRQPPSGARNSAPIRYPQGVARVPQHYRRVELEAVAKSLHLLHRHGLEGDDDIDALFFDPEGFSRP
jgi:hypothetical protein